MNKIDFLASIPFIIIILFLLISGTIPLSKDLNKKYCHDIKTDSKLSYNQALEIAKKSKCGTMQELTFTQDYKCNIIDGTWQVDLTYVDNMTKNSQCQPTCIVNVTKKTADFNWGCSNNSIPTHLQK